MLIRNWVNISNFELGNGSSGQEKEVDELLSWGYELRQKNMGFPSVAEMIERKEVFHETGMERISLGSHCSLRVQQLSDRSFWPHAP